MNLGSAVPRAVGSAKYVFCGGGGPDRVFNQDIKEPREIGITKHIDRLLIQTNQLPLQFAVESEYRSRNTETG